MQFNRIFYGSLAGAAFLLACLLPFGLGQNFDIHFGRDVPLMRPLLDAQGAMSHLSQWPGWFFHLVEAKNITSPEADAYKKGDHLLLFIDPKKGPWRKFEIEVEVTRSEPGKTLGLRVIKDSKDRLEKLLSQIEWQIDLNSTRVRGEATALTAGFRGRLFGRITDKILMAQVFYPNLLKLADAADPTQNGINLQGGM